MGVVLDHSSNSGGVGQGSHGSSESGVVSRGVVGVVFSGHLVGSVDDILGLLVLFLDLVNFILDFFSLSLDGLGFVKELFGLLVGSNEFFDFIHGCFDLTDLSSVGSTLSTCSCSSRSSHGSHHSSDIQGHLSH